MDAKKIIVVTETLGVDGPERVIAELINEWKKMGYEIIVVLTRAELREATFRIDNSIKIRRITAHAKGGFFSRINEAIELRRILRQFPGATGISFLVSTSFSLAVASIGLRIQVILSERNDPNQVPFTRLQRKMRDYSMALADACVFQTKDAKKYFSERIQKKGVIIPNPVDPALPKMFHGERRKIFIAVGRLARQKNHAILIEAFSLLAEKYPDYNLMIFGEGPERDDLEKQIAARELSGRVIMPGFSNNVYNEMIDCMAYVSSSDFEGMSNSMLEAMAMGLPVICTDCPIGGARAVISDRDNGLLVPVGDGKAIRDAMEFVIENPELASNMGMNAQKLRDQLSIHSIANEWTKLF